MIQLIDETCPVCGERLYRDENGIYHCKNCDSKMEAETKKAIDTALKAVADTTTDAGSQKVPDAESDDKKQIKRTRALQQQIDNNSKKKMLFAEWIVGALVFICLFAIITNKFFLHIPLISRIAFLLVGISSFFTAFTLLIAKQKSLRNGAFIIFAIILLVIAADLIL